jgi:hypothetical protein
LKQFAELSNKCNEAFEDGRINDEELQDAHAFMIRVLPTVAAAMPASIPLYMNGFYKQEQMLHITLETFKKGGMQIVSVPVPVNAPETNSQQQN